MATSRYGDNAKTAEPANRLARSSTQSLTVYQQLHVVLRRRIVDGHFAAGKALPGENVLARDYGVSRVTVRRTLAMLEDEGLIEKRRGVGTFVRVRDDVSNPPPLKGTIDNLITVGLASQARLIASGRAVPPARIAKALAIPACRECLRIERFWHNDEDPFSVTVVWLSDACAALIDVSELGDEALVRVLEDAGVAVASADQVLGATAADDHAAKLLGVNIGAPLLRLFRTIRSDDETPLMTQESVYIPERYEYHMQLRRDASTGRSQWRYNG